MKKFMMYEEAAKRVVSDMRAEFGIIDVTGKKKLPGSDGSVYELDAIAWTDEAGSFLLVEAKQQGRRLSQDAVNSILYKFQKVGAGGAILVSPMPLQSGAQKAADYDNLVHIKLTADSTAQDYLAEYLGRRFHGTSISETATATDQCDAVVIKGGASATFE
jgi:hypothetical protein